MLRLASNLPQVLQADVRSLADEDIGPNMLDKWVREEGSPGCCAIFSENLEEEHSLCLVLAWKDLLDGAWEKDCKYFKHTFCVEQCIRKVQLVNHEHEDLAHVDIRLPVLIKRWPAILVELRA